MSKKTDLGKILYPESLSVADRRHCRRMIVSVAKCFKTCDNVIVSCSGGIDSTVVVHAVGQALRIHPYNESGALIKATAVYLNHHLRPNEVNNEAEHVQKISATHLSHVTPHYDLDVKKGPALQERARDARYKALGFLVDLIRSRGDQRTIFVMTGHNKNDLAETRLFQFLKGREVNGISKIQNFTHTSYSYDTFLVRPLLDFSRLDIERYAKAFNLSWCEDSSNQTDVYTRNKIRHHLIPWIKENVNPGVISTLGRVY